MSKNEYAKFKRIYDHGTLITKADPNIGFNIKLFSVKGMFSQLKQNPEKESDIKSILKKLNEEKGEMNLTEYPSNEEFNEFMDNMFANVDDQDRFGEVTLRTASSFRICADLIEVFKNWGEIPSEWVQKSK